MKDCKFLYDKFGEEKIKQRYVYLFSKMEAFIKELEYSNVQINTTILNQVIIDYFTDIYRTKEFHEISRVNKRKIIAYQTYWLLRRKPIVIFSTDPQDINESEYDDAFINERFALSYITQEFLLPSLTPPINENVEKEFSDYLRHLLYHLKCRYIDQQYLELILYSFDLGRFFEPNIHDFDMEEDEG